VSEDRSKYYKWARLNGFISKLQPGSGLFSSKKTTKTQVSSKITQFEPHPPPDLLQKRYGRTAMNSPKSILQKAVHFHPMARERPPKSMTKFIFHSCWIASIASLVFALGCVGPQTVSINDSASSQADQREQAMPKSKIKNSPRGAGLDSRAREIESSLGVR